MDDFLNGTIHSSRYEGSVLWDYSGCNHRQSRDIYECRHAFESESYIGRNIEKKGVDISLVEVGTVNRLLLLPIVAARWVGYFPFISMLSSFSSS